MNDFEKRKVSKPMKWEEDFVIFGILQNPTVTVTIFSSNALMESVPGALDGVYLDWLGTTPKK